MLQAIKELGEQKLKREKRDISNILSIILEDSNINGNCPKVLVAVFKKEGSNISYEHIRIEDNSKEKISKYLYCRGSSRGSNYSPTAKITEIEKTFKNKIESWFEKYKDRDQLINGLKSAIENSKEKILKDLSDQFNKIKPSLKRNQVCLFTLTIEDEGELKYLGDFQVFKDLSIESVEKDYQRIKQEKHICSVCGEVKDEVYGDAIPFAFYTIDKPGYIAGGFYEEDAWKNAPVCLECVLKIEEGKKFLNEKLKSTMGGQQYYLIPKFIIGVEGTEEIIDTFFNYFEHRDDLLREKTLRKITEDEKEILEELGKLKDVLTYNFLFFKEVRNKFEIKLLIEDILPSRISVIFEAKKRVENKEIFKNVKVKKNKYENIEFRFDVLKQFIPSQKTYFEIVDKIFRGLTIDKNLIFSLFLNKIYQSFINEEYLKPLVLQAFVCFLFLKELGILPKNENYKNGGKRMNELKEKAEEFFKSFSDTFYTSAHKAVFLLGVLTQKLLNIQYQERGGATPFRKSLKGLKMKEDDFKSLLAKIQNKLEEYKKNYYRSLEALISEYFVEAGRNWKINSDELNFYFVLGMNLEDYIDKVLNLTEKEVQK